MNFDDPANNRTDDESDAFVSDCLGDIQPSEQECQMDKPHDRPADQPMEVQPTEAQPGQFQPREESERIAVGADEPAQLKSRVAPQREPHSMHLATSTLLSLLMVLLLLLVARLVVPSLVESIRYGWHHGELRAEYELSGQRLRSVSLDSLADVSQLVSQRVGPSVVHINLLRDDDTANKFEALFGGGHPSMRLEGQGSGFVIDAEGYVLTNHHVVDGVGSIEVTLSDGRQLPATVIGSDPPTDLAILKIEAGGLMAVDWGDSDEVVVGTPVWAAGSPFGLQQTVTFGIISGKHRVDFRGTRYEESIHGGTAYGDLMQSDVALNPGNSGGPLVNSMGQVVGVNAAILGETYRGISFSIPSRVAQRVATYLIEEGEVPRGWLGVRMQDLATSERYDESGKVKPGVRIVGFPQGPSPARDGGMKVGDIIIEFAGQNVMNQVGLMKMIGETDVGNSATVTVLRQNERFELDVAIGKREIGWR